MALSNPRTEAERAAQSRLRRVLVAAGLAQEFEQAEDGRLGPNATFKIPYAGGTLVRISEPGNLAYRVDKTVRLGRWFEQIDAPTIRLAEGFTEPVKLLEEDGRPFAASMWKFVTPSRPVTAQDLAIGLKEFHTATASPPEWLELPTFNALNEIRDRLTQAQEALPKEVGLLLDRTRELREELEKSPIRNSREVAHGDAQPNNLLVDQDGRVLWCDFDATGLGSHKYDLATILTAHQRFGRESDDPGPLAEVYGFDIAADPDVDLLCDIRELKIVSAAVTRLSQHPAIGEEFDRRFKDLWFRHKTAPWIPYDTAIKNHDRTRPPARRSRPAAAERASDQQRRPGKGPTT